MGKLQHIYRSPSQDAQGYTEFRNRKYSFNKTLSSQLPSCHMQNPDLEATAEELPTTYRAGLEKQAAEGDGEQQKNLNPSPRKTNEPTHQWREPGETVPLDPQKHTSPETPRISQGNAEVMLV